MTGPTTDENDQLDLVFAALASRLRRSIVLTLAGHPSSIAQLAEQHEVTLPAIHRHIVTLEAAGLVQRRKAGRVNYLALTRDGVLAGQEWLGQFHAYWGSPDESLDNYIAGMSRTTTRGTHQ